jgi:hypothetical protein
MCCSETYPMLAVLRDDVRSCCPSSAPGAKVRCNWRIVEADDRGWVWQRNGPNTRKQPPGNSNSDSKEMHSKQSRLAELQRKARAMTAQHSSSGTQHTQRARRGLVVGGGVWRWFIKTRASGVGRPQDRRAANHAQRPHRADAGVGREATKLPRYSVRSHQYHRAGSLLAGVVLPVLYTAGEAED